MIVIIDPKSQHAAIAEAMVESNRAFFEDDGGKNNVRLSVGQDRVELLFDECGQNFKPFFIDFSDKKFLSRLQRAGRNSEAVARAVIGRLSAPVVYDATAGLGRDSFIMQRCGAQVFMFERNPAIWLLLNDGLCRAKADASLMNLFPAGLPVLMQQGTLIELNRAERLPVPDVVYYDPMFPQTKKSALVKKDMQIFHSIVGADEDVTANLRELVTLPKHRLIFKRPDGAEVLSAAQVARSGYVDGKACRFDIYKSCQS